jgi:hypothetical protein
LNRVLGVDAEFDDDVLRLEEEEHLSCEEDDIPLMFFLER